MLKERKQIIWLLGMVLIVFIFMVIISTFLNNQKLKKYPILKKGDQIESVVSSVCTNRGGAYILFSNNERRTIMTSYNFNYKPSAIVDFIKVGDYFEKKAFVDTIIIHRVKQNYYFLLGNDIPKE